jgi:hypothetical protein
LRAALIGGLAEVPLAARLDSGRAARLVVVVVVDDGFFNGAAN